MPKSKSRENKAATTFWMDKILKKKAQGRVQAIDGMTLTDLINQAVGFYLEEGHKLDKEFGQKLAMAELAQDIKQSGQREMIIAEMSQVIRGLQARLNEMETRIENIVSGEALQQTISTHISARIGPTVERLSSIIELLTPSIQE